jgi:hypothetical protein
MSGFFFTRRLLSQDARLTCAGFARTLLVVVSWCAASACIIVLAIEDDDLMHRNDALWVFVCIYASLFLTGPVLTSLQNIMPRTGAGTRAPVRIPGDNMA